MAKKKQEEITAKEVTTPTDRQKMKEALKYVPKNALLSKDAILKIQNRRSIPERLKDTQQKDSPIDSTGLKWMINPNKFDVSGVDTLHADKNLEKKKIFQESVDGKKVYVYEIKKVEEKPMLIKSVSGVIATPEKIKIKEELLNKKTESQSNRQTSINDRKRKIAEAEAKQKKLQGSVNELKEKIKGMKEIGPEFKQIKDQLQDRIDSSKINAEANEKGVKALLARFEAPKIQKLDIE